MQEGSLFSTSSPAFIVCNYFVVVIALSCCFARAFSSCSEQGLLFVVVCGIPIAAASLVGAQALGHTGFRSCGAWPLESWPRSCGALGLVAPERVGSSWARD